MNHLPTHLTINGVRHELSPLSEREERIKPKRTIKPEEAHLFIKEPRKKKRKSRAVVTK